MKSNRIFYSLFKKKKLEETTSSFLKTLAFELENENKNENENENKNNKQNDKLIVADVLNSRKRRRRLCKKDL